MFGVRPIIFSGLLLLCLGQISCHRPRLQADGIQCEVHVSPQPVRTGPVAVEIRLQSGAGEMEAGAGVGVEADMTHPGMAPVFAKASESSPGLYRARLQLTMPGDWVILLHGRLKDGTTWEREVDVKGVRAE